MVPRFGFQSRGGPLPVARNLMVTGGAFTIIGSRRARNASRYAPVSRRSGSSAGSMNRTSIHSSCVRQAPWRPSLRLILLDLRSNINSFSVVAKLPIYLRLVG